MNLTLRKAKKNELDWINSKYDEVGFIHSDFEKEILVIAELDSIKAGLGRLVAISPNILELGGIYVFEAFMGKGIAGKIVEKLLSYTSANQKVFCLPFSKLTPFYMRYGFRECTAKDKIPKVIKDKACWCNSTYEDSVPILIKQCLEKDPLKE